MINLSNRNLAKYEVPRNTHELDVSHNSIQVLAYLPESLQILNISYNKIAMIDSINPSNCLHLLNLSYNRLISIEGIIHLNKLKILDLSYNFLSADQLTHLKPLKTLKTLNLSHNHLSSVTAFDHLNFLDSLIELNMSFNDFLKIIIKTPMISMKKLILDNNKLTNLNLDNFPKLEFISCINNNITQFYGLTSLNQLSYLYADGNELTELPFLAKLKILSISHNRLSNILHYPSLEVLNASYNCLGNIEKVSSLVMEMNVSHNILTMLPFRMKGVEILDFSHNNIRKVDFVIGCKKLKVISAAGNDMENPEEMLEFLAKCPLEDVDLGFEFEDKVFYAYLNALPLLKKINLYTITEEDRDNARKNMEISELHGGKKDESWEQERTLCLEIPEISGESVKDKESAPNSCRNAFLDKLSPNLSAIEEAPKKPYMKNLTTSADSSVDLTIINSDNKTQPLNTQTSSKNPYLSPSKTEGFLITPTKTIEEEKITESLQSSPEINTGAFLSDHINDICKSLAAQIHQSISDKFEDLVKTQQSFKRKRCKHRCKHHKAKQATAISIGLDTDSIKVEGKTYRSSSVKNSKVIASQESKKTIIEKESNSLWAYENEIAEQSFKYQNTLSLSSMKNSSESLFKYAIIPPRPILKSEYNSSLVVVLGTQSREHQIVVSYFAKYNFHITKVRKGYTFGLLKGRYFSDIMFYYAEKMYLISFIYSSKGFDRNNIVLYRKPQIGYSAVLMCLTNLNELRQINNDIYQIEHNKQAVPVYLVSYINSYRSLDNY